MSLPMMAFAPPRLSMTSGWPSTFSTSFAMTRAFASVAPPGGNGTTRRIGRVGQVCPEPAEGVCAAPTLGSTAATYAITGSKQDSGYLTLIVIPYVMRGHHTPRAKQASSFPDAYRCSHVADIQRLRRTRDR